MNPTIRNLLALGIILPAALAAAYLIRPAPHDDIVTISTLVAICIVTAFSMLALARCMSAKPLIYFGTAGYVATVLMIALFVRKALAPITW
ncbi:MAG: hypothetical protein MUE42_11285 [Opitutaceae bacterium]|nr:hypothetical protein [Opitutaceae bacterium]